MTELPPPRPQVAPPPPRPRPQPQLAPLPPRRHFYSGYQWWHWALLAVGAVFLIILFGPAYIAILRAFG